MKSSLLSRSAIGSLAALSLCSGVAFDNAQAASPTPPPTAPTSQAAKPAAAPNSSARAHGINVAGQAYLGWSADTSPAAGVSAVAASPAARVPALASTRIRGIDVSGHQGYVAWRTQWNRGVRFAYVKATEGTTFRNGAFSHQYRGSYNAGMVRGSYHFALPSPTTRSAFSQADWFVNNGGGWSADGKTLPGVLDIEYNPYGRNMCYGMTRAQMVDWINVFTKRYKYRTGRNAVIYTTNGWWRSCTGNSTKFAATNPLWIARYAASPGTLPGGWSTYRFWQYTDRPIDQDVYNGTRAGLRRYALG